VLRLLLEDSAYAGVTVLARRELPLAHKKLQQRVVGFDRLAQIADFPRVHDVFCCLGTTMKQVRERRSARSTTRTSSSSPGSPSGTAPRSSSW